jgi:hypothetical protein
MPGILGISAFLRQHDSYVVAARQGELLGTRASGEGTTITLTPRTSCAGSLANRSVVVYQVRRAPAPCLTAAGEPEPALHHSTVHF